MIKYWRVESATDRLGQDFMENRVRIEVRFREILENIHKPKIYFPPAVDMMVDNLGINRLSMI